MSINTGAGSENIHDTINTSQEPSTPDTRQTYFAIHQEVRPLPNMVIALTSMQPDFLRAASASGTRMDYMRFMGFNINCL